MSKRPSFGNQFEKLKALGAARPLAERKQAVEAKASLTAGGGGLTSLSSILEESLSRVDSVEDEQGPKRTESEIEPVQAEQTGPVTSSSLDTVTVSSENPVQLEQNSGLTVSETETVEPGHCEKRGVSKTDTESGEGRNQSPARSATGGFTAVTHGLLRGEAKFSDPLDFMVYMHLYSYSHGFNRQTADMSQSQLERFTGAAKNTIKRSLERLVKDGWIKMVENFECARMSRKWRVFTPEDRRGGPRPGQRGKTAVSAGDSGQKEQGPAQTGGLSNADTPTVSRIDPYIERRLKEKSNHSLSVKFSSDRLTRYFAELAPARKRESELLGYRELARDFAESEIDAALEFLQKQGLPGTGQPCHSPMAYLGKAIKEVLVRVERDRALDRERGESQRRQEEDRRRREEEDELASREWAVREAAFYRAFPGEDRQAEVIAELCRGMPFLAHSQVGRTYAVGKWWEGLNQFERME